MALIKTEEQISKMKEASRIVGVVHDELKKAIKPGVTLLELDELAVEIINREGGKATFKGFSGFPKSICASVNDVMVHGIPNGYPLKDGDIVSIDVGVIKDGWNGDAAFTMGVGNVTEKANKIMSVTKEALASAIKFAKPGVTLGQLGAHIESFATKNGFTAAKEFVGHGIGETMHEDPYIFNYANDSDFALKENMTICIEPMFIDGPDDLFIDPLDKWTVRPHHGGLTTHDEHTIVIRKNGGEILTKS